MTTNWLRRLQLVGVIGMMFGRTFGLHAGSSGNPIVLLVCFGSKCEIVRIEPAMFPLLLERCGNRPALVDS